MKSKLNYLHFILVFIAVPYLMISCSDDLNKRDSLRPAIDSITPESAKPGDIITISGTGFGSDASSVKVQFNNIYATNIVSVSESQIEVETPPGFAGEVVHVRVFVSEIATPTVQFFYTDTTIPHITNTTTTFFYNSTVIITGTNFSPIPTDNIVKFGDVEGEVVEATNTSLTVITPELGEATTADITVTKYGELSNAVTVELEPDQDKVSRHEWTTHTARPGVIYKTGAVTLFDGSERRIHILDVTLDNTNTLGIGVTETNEPSAFKSTMAICEDYDAIAGINAGYFQLGTAAYKDPYIRIDGETVELGTNEPISTHFTNAALLIHDNVATVRRLGTSGNTLNEVAANIPVEEAKNVIVSGPMLINNREVEVVNPTNAHNTATTARTGLGVTADGKRVFMVVVDHGNGSTGVTTPQLGQILQALGAVNAMNFDGGGSSTMFVQHHSNNGLINIPSGIVRSVHSVIYVK